MAVKAISQLSEEQFAYLFHGLLEEILKDPLERFIKAEGMMNFDPTPAQAVALKCVFGQLLDETTLHEVYEEYSDEDTEFGLEKVQMTEVEIYEQMTGFRYDGDLQKARTRINLIIGRRGGKTTLSAMLAIFGSIKTNWKPYLTKTPSATVAVLSHTKELSEEILDIIRQLVEESEVLSRLIDPNKKNTQSTFNLKIPFIEKTNSGTEYIQYSRVTIKVGAASKKTIRGRAIPVLLCDEIAFWGTEENAAERDEDILRAARPSLLQFKDKSLLMKLSSPGIKQGVLYNEWEKREELPDTYITFKAPSWVWNTILAEKDFQEEHKLDPVGFATEFRADFVDSISNFILPEFVDLCTFKGATFHPPEPKGTDVVYSAAIDAAFKGDRFTFTLEGAIGGKIKQYVMKDWKGTRKTPVKSSEVAEYIRNVCLQYGISRVHADQFAFQPLREIFEQYGITLMETTFTNKFKKQIYFNLKKLIHNQQLDLLHHEQLLKEIKQLQVEQTSTGTVRIGHPPGGHDDCADSTAIAAFILTENMGKLGIDLSEVAGPRHDIPVDATGKAFKAPSPEMLGDFMGSPVQDNSFLFERDPVTGELRLKEDLEDLDASNEDGVDFLF